jgi:Sec-independent protein translocase protein TatA
MPHFGLWELLAVLFVGFVVFGTRLPRIAWRVGKSIINFRQSTAKADVVNDVQNLLRGERKT